MTAWFHCRDAPQVSVAVLPNTRLKLAGLAWRVPGDGQERSAEIVLARRVPEVALRFRQCAGRCAGDRPQRHVGLEDAGASGRQDDGTPAEQVPESRH